ncbi:hypothetical protein ACBJ59_12250 [Nonomuraea sp. MTCD27]|uniref:hypothetical protein n=1 Tax=Nonomuraea sp. MTCD27 TaxID=1676747 RepID=UPI0035C041BA
MAWKTFQEGLSGQGCLVPVAAAGMTHNPASWSWRAAWRSWLFKWAPLSFM